MNKLLYKLTLIAFVLPSMIFANGGKDKFKGKHTKEKTITKEFSVNSDALLKVSNSYGTVYLTSWDKNTIAIEVTIKTNGNSESKVTERLAQIGVDFTDSPTMVNAKTRFNDGSKAWWKWNKRNNVNVNVNYTIKFPKGNELDISNDHGKIFVDRVENKVSLSSDYGGMEIGELLSDNNTLSFDYTNNVTVAYMKGGRISADYSSFKVNEAENIKLNADYTKSVFGKVNTIEYTCDYKSLQIDEATNIEGVGDYLSLRLGKVAGNLDLEADYGSIKIAEMTNAAGDVNIESEYAGIKIGFQPNYNFSFEFDLEYASLKGEEYFNINKKRVEDGESYYEGYHGNNSNTNNIKITSEYGSIRFTKL